MIGTQDELLSWIMSMKEWYLLMKEPCDRITAGRYKTSLADGSMTPRIKQRLCEQLGITILREEVVLPAVYEYRRFKEPQNDVQMYLTNLIFGYSLPHQDVNYRKEQLRLQRLARGERDKRRLKNEKKD